MSESLSRTPIKIVVKGKGEAKGELVRFSAPLTVETLLSRLPLEGRAHRRGGGLSTIIGIKRGAEKGSNSVKAGDIAYWPMGNALCIFHGETQPYSPVNVVGKVTKNLHIFEETRSGKKIRVERI